jgi:hypothetical protein
MKEVPRPTPGCVKAGILLLWHGKGKRGKSRVKGQGSRVKIKAGASTQEPGVRRRSKADS